MFASNPQKTALKFLDFFEPHPLTPDCLKVSAYVLSKGKETPFENHLVQQLPDCYISSKHLKQLIEKTGMTPAALIQNKYPDRGAVMAGDFGEIITLNFLQPTTGITSRKIKKWRLKEDRRKAAPHSDVVILCRADEKKPSIKDYVICAEAKVKSTKSKKYCPITNSIEGYQKDRTGRLGRTITWLKEKAIESGEVDEINFMKRFADDHVKLPYSKRFKAVALIDQSFLKTELEKKITIPDQSDEFEMLVIGIPDFKNKYQRCYSRSIEEVSFA